jgi:hypothetical protein
MRISRVLIITAAILVSACKKEEKGFTVSGKLEHNRSDMIYLKEMTSRELLPLQT